MEDHLLAMVSQCPAANALLVKHGSSNFAINIDIANHLKAAGFFAEASHFFGIAYAINRLSKEVLLAKLTVELQAGIHPSADEIEALKSLDPAYFALYSVKASADDPPIQTLRRLQNYFEHFKSGSEIDWIFLRAAMQIVNIYPHALTTPIRQAKPDIIPRRLVFYWDKDPPAEVLANVEHHKQLRLFDVEIYSKPQATEFIERFYGHECRNLFLKMRHPSEESDFFRFHLINTLGGYYLDTDEQIISKTSFEKHLVSSEDSIFVLSDSGPVHSAFFGSTAGSSVIEECLKILYHNCYNYPNLSMWLKTGPGPITRSLVRAYYKHLFAQHRLASFELLDEQAYPKAIRAVTMSYRGDARDWRVYEKMRDQK